MIPLLAILYFGGYVLTAACFLIGIMGVREFYNGFHAMGVKPNYGIAVAAAAALYIINIFGEKSEWYMLWFFGVVLVSMLYLFNIEHLLWFTGLLSGAVIGVLGGIVSQFGDLTASIFKRKMGIKDYGHLIPGHGGILDRFDSVLFTGPMVYYYIVLVIGYMP